MTLIERLRKETPDYCPAECADRLEQAEQLIDELESALSEAKYCLDGYYGFSGEIEKALASAKAWKDGT